MKITLIVVNKSTCCLCASMSCNGEFYINLHSIGCFDEQTNVSDFLTS